MGIRRWVSVDQRRNKLMWNTLPVVEVVVDLDQAMTLKKNQIFKGIRGLSLQKQQNLESVKELMSWKEQCDRDPNYRYKHSRKDMYSIWCYR